MNSLRMHQVYLFVAALIGVVFIVAQQCVCDFVQSGAFMAEEILIRLNGIWFWGIKSTIDETPNCKPYGLVSNEEFDLGYHVRNSALKAAQTAGFGGIGLLGILAGLFDRTKCRRYITFNALLLASICSPLVFIFYAIDDREMYPDLDMLSKQISTGSILLIVACGAFPIATALSWFDIDVTNETDLLHSAI